MIPSTITTTIQIGTATIATVAIIRRAKVIIVTLQTAKAIMQQPEIPNSTRATRQNLKILKLMEATTIQSHVAHQMLWNQCQKCPSILAQM